MAAGRSAWPVVLLIGLCLAVGAGIGAAVAFPSDSAVRITGTVTALGGGSLTLEQLVVYEDPPRARRGPIEVRVLSDLATPHLRPGDTIDVEVRRIGGGWVADRVTLLDPD